MGILFFFKRILPLSLIPFLLLACAKRDNETVDSRLAAVNPTVVQQVEPINAFTPEHVANLTKIVIAIEKYKQKNHSYPISSGLTKSWDRTFAGEDGLNSEWLNILVPEYIDSIPMATSDPSPPEYVYKSNGAHYKLLVLKPSDCRLVRLKKPDLVDPRRGCAAYGFWTSQATRW